MNAYVVRLGADHRHPREIVGFFFADDRRQLYDMIDECCDVEGCEVLELEPGGIFWSSATDYEVPLSPEMRTEDAPGLPGDAIATESWSSVLFEESEHRWEPITSAELSEIYRS